MTIYSFLTAFQFIEKKIFIKMIYFEYSSIVLVYIIWENVRQSEIIKQDGELSILIKYMRLYFR